MSDRNVSKYIDRYRARATGKVMPVGLNYLSDLVIRPGIEKVFGPLLLYRGNMNRGHAHRLWNFALLMMAAECETLADGFRILNNPAFSQLCGPPKAPGMYSMWNYFGRLSDNPAVTNNVEGLTEYVKFMGATCALIRVDRFSDEPDCAPWRISVHPDAADYIPRERGIPKSEQLFYPFLKHDAERSGDDDLVLLVNKAVPPYLPDHIRADACQDLIVAVLAGEISRDQIQDRAKNFVGNVFKQNNWKFGDRSLDAPMGTADGRFTLLDVLSD